MAATGGSTPIDPLLLAVTFTPPGGTFVAERQVELAVNDPAVEIHYTLDGSAPEASSPLYEGPLELDGSARVRARAFLPGDDQPRGPIFSASYLRVSEEVADFTSNLPIVVVHTFESGQLNAKGTEFEPAWLSLSVPSSGTTELVGDAALQSGIGIHVRGQTSRDFPKKQYAVELRDDTSGDDRKLSLLGMPAESDWVLSDALVFDRTSLRNALAYEMSNRIGRYAPRTRFVEVFLADQEGDVSSESFVGIYTLIEKIKRDGQRVDVGKLEEGENEQPAVTGGYILSIDKGGAELLAGNQQFHFVYPDAELMVTAARAPQFDFIRDYLEDLDEALKAPDFIGPSHGQHYSEFMDVDSFIDHQIVNALSKNVDGLRLSTYFHKDRGGLLVAGPVWDFDRSLGTPYDRRATDPEEWTLEDSDGTKYFDQGYWGLLFEDPSFKARYKERFLALLEQELSPSQLTALVDSLAAQIGPAAVARNFERWNEFPPAQDSYENELSILKTFLERRAAFIQRELEAWP